MSDDGLPRNIARGIVLAAILGAVALTVREPVAGVAALSGIVLAGGSLGFDGSVGAVARSALLLTVGAFGTVAAVGVAVGVSPAAVAVTGPAALVGVGLVGIASGRPSALHVRRARRAALTGGILAGTLATFALGPDPVVGSVLEPWITGSGLLGPLVGATLAAMALAIGINVLPPSTFGPPGSPAMAVRGRKVAAALIVVVLALVAALAMAPTTLAPADPGTALLSLATAVRVVRAALAGVAILGIVLLFVGVGVRVVWTDPDDRGEPFVGTLVGAGAGVGVAILAAVLASPAGPGQVRALAGVTAVLLGAGYGVSRAAKVIEARRLPTAPTAVALGLGLGVVAGEAVAVTAGRPAAGLGTQVASLVAVATGLLAYDVGRYGRRMVEEVGQGGVTPRPQFVRLGWSASVAAVGLVVAVVGLQAGSLLAPTLSVPASAGALAGLAGLVGAAWLLLR